MVPSRLAVVRILCGAIVCAALLDSGAASAQQPDSAWPSPRLLAVFPPGGRLGTVVEVAFTGTDLEEPEQLRFSQPGIKSEPIIPPPPPVDPKNPPKPDAKKPPVVISKFKVTIPGDVKPGFYDVRFVGKFGVSNPRTFAVGDLAELQEKEPNNDVAEATRIEVNSTVNGVLSAPTDVDYFVFAGKKGQRIVASCLASSIDSRAHPEVNIYDARDRLLASGRDHRQLDALADCVLPDDGDYTVRVSEFAYSRGGPDYFYRLTVGVTPWIDAVFPAVVEAGKTTAVTVWGRNLPGGQPDPEVTAHGRTLEKATINVTAPADFRQMTYSGPIGPASASFGGFELRTANPFGSSNPYFMALARAPVVVDNGANDTPETAQPVTTPCEIAGRIEKRRDQDWYVFTAKKGEVLLFEADSERLGSQALVFFNVRNAENKQPYYETPLDWGRTSGMKFNTHDEDPPTYRFVAPADGKYLLQVGSRVSGTLFGHRHFYRIRVTREEPDFSLVVMPAAEVVAEGTTVLQGGNAFFSVFAHRSEGFVGDVNLAVEGLPAGVTCVPQTLGGALKLAQLVVSAAPGAAPWVGDVKIKGTAVVNGQPVVREARPLTILFAVQPGQNLPAASRLDRTLTMAVRPGAPYALAATIDKPSLVQEDKATLTVKLNRMSPDFKTPLTVQPQPPELPPGMTVNNNQPITIAPDKAEGTLPIAVNADVQPGVYTIVLRTSAPVPFNKDPAAKDKPQINVVLPSTPVVVTVLPKALAKVELGGSPTIKPGAQAEVVVRVQRKFGYAGPFKVQLVLPPNVKGVGAAEAEVPAGQNEVKLIVKADGGAEPGNRTDLIVRLTAVYNGATTVTQEAKFNVNVVK